MSSALPASSRQATQVLTGPFRSGRSRDASPAPSPGSLPHGVLDSARAPEAGYFPTPHPRPAAGTSPRVGKSWRQVPRPAGNVSGEELRAFAKWGFCVAWFDVDPVAGQLGGEAGILTVAADGEGQLSSRHQHPGGARERVDRHPLGPCQAEGRPQQNLPVIPPRDEGPPLAGRLRPDRPVL